MTHRIDRRTLLRGAASTGAVSLSPIPAIAQGKTLVAATFPDMWSVLHRGILAAAFVNASGDSVKQPAIYGTEQLKQLINGKGARPPFDVALFNSLHVPEAVNRGLIAEYPIAQSPNYPDLLPRFQDKWGPCITVSVMGIGYNPKSMTAPPKNWDELSATKFKGRIGLIAPTTILGVTFLAELNRLKGGTEDDFEPAFKALRALLPNVGGIAANSEAFDMLWQREQIDIAPHDFNRVQTLKTRGIPVELAMPESGKVGWLTTMHLVADATEPGLAVKYIDLHLDRAVQAEMQLSEFRIVPTNSKVKLEGLVAQVVARDPEDFGKIRSFDWTKLYLQREALIERFNREIKL